MELKDYVRMFRRSWVLILSFTLFGAAGMATLCMATTFQYVASTQLYVSVQPAATAGTNELVQGGTFARQAVASYLVVAKSALVLDEVINDQGLNLTTAELASTIETSSPSDTQLIDISVANSDPVLAARIADSVAEHLGETVVDKLESASDGVVSPVTITTIESALVPTKPTSPNVPLNIVLGALAGLAVGIGIAVLQNALDTRIHGARDIELVTRTPVLGSIANDPEAKSRPLVVHVDPRNPRAESFRSLRTNLQFVNVEGGPRSFVITSSIAGEGKSTTTANLAIAMAGNGKRVALIDGDLRLPRLAEYLGLESGAGLTDVLIGRAELDDVLQKWGSDELFVLPSGAIPPNPSELLGSAPMQRMLATLTEQFDIVLIDSPPLLSVTDAAVLSNLCGGALIVVASGRTKRNELLSAVQVLDRVGSRLVGMVLNMVPTTGPDGYGKLDYGTLRYDSLPPQSVLDADVPADTVVPSNVPEKTR